MEGDGFVVHRNPDGVPIDGEETLDEIIVREILYDLRVEDLGFRSFDKLLEVFRPVFPVIGTDEVAIEKLLELLICQPAG